MLVFRKVYKSLLLIYTPLEKLVVFCYFDDYISCFFTNHLVLILDY